MPMHLDRYYDVRPRWPNWTWSAFERDFASLIGTGETATRAEAEGAARACIAGHLAGIGTRVHRQSRAMPRLQFPLAIQGHVAPNRSSKGAGGACDDT